MPPVDKKLLLELRERAEQRVAASEGHEPKLRTCWNCDPGHAFLKSSPFVLLCTVCTRIYFEGVDITLTDEDIKERRKHEPLE